MGVCDAPQWLLSTWLRTCQHAGATVANEQIEEAGIRLLRRWAHSDRHFHDLRHLADVLTRVDELAEETHDCALVRLAAFYHGVVFDSRQSSADDGRGGEDELASAALAESELLSLGIPAANARRVSALIAALAHHTPPAGDIDAAALCDADLATLAVEPQRYRAYLDEVRAEYADVATIDYVRARICILTHLLGRPSLFFSPLGEVWEEPARQNVSAELHRLQKHLHELVPEAPEAPELAEEDDDPVETRHPQAGAIQAFLSGHGLH